MTALPQHELRQRFLHADDIGAALELALDGRGVARDVSLHSVLETS